MMMMMMIGALVMVQRGGKAMVCVLFCFCVAAAKRERSDGSGAKGGEAQTTGIFYFQILISKFVKYFLISKLVKYLSAFDES